MNPANILALISDLYQQIAQLRSENATLLQKIATPEVPEPIATPEVPEPTT